MDILRAARLERRNHRDHYFRHYKPFNDQLDLRLTATAEIALAESDHVAHDWFACNFEAIDDAMMEGREGIGLRHAWNQFKETIVDPSENPLRATARPEGYFLHLGDETRVLAWWANIFVAIGLTFTFLGIVAALHQTVRIMGAGGANVDMLAALTGLLKITAAKFWTSIGGVLASIVLRIVDRRWHSAMDRKLERLCDRIEYGTLHSPPQRIAAAQLRELEQQSVALTEFSHQLAASIGDALGQHMQPVVAGLGGIQSSLNEFRDGSFSQIGKELGEAISRSAGIEMEGLAAALTGMTTGLQGVNDRLEGASGQASDQIATAAREFSTASEQMTRAFAALNDNMAGMADTLAGQAAQAEQRVLDRVAEDRASYDAMATGQRDVMRAMGEEMRTASTAASGEMVRAVQAAVREAMGESQTAIRGALEGFAGATAGIQSAFDAMRGQVADLGTKLSDSASGAAERNADVLAKAADALERATTQASAGMSDAVSQAVTRSAEESGKAISAAFAAFGERFEAASAGLVQTLTTTAGRMEALSGAIARSTDAASDHAGKLADAGREAQGVATMLGRAANDVAGAAAPIRDATTTIQDSVGHSQDLLRRSAESSTRQHEAMQTIAGSLEATGTAAARAWDGYRTRFAEVDESLARALAQISGASSEHASALNAHVGRIDSALGAAVERLAGALDDIKDLANTLEDLRGHYEAAAE
ncbi:hypothetical protein [Sphingomonas sp.]|uniref:hypothetical protein n=1 Tax=Sphingomonas sp. TaxID=28214 RepID=UPI0035BC34B2